jgi:hypothetical protein
LRRIAGSIDVPLLKAGMFRFLIQAGAELAKAIDGTARNSGR